MKCENCGHIIGRNDTPCVYDEHTVCQSCHDELSAEPTTAGQRVSSAAWNATTSIVVFIAVGFLVLVVAAGSYAVYRDWNKDDKGTVTVRVRAH